MSVAGTGRRSVPASPAQRPAAVRARRASESWRRSRDAERAHATTDQAARRVR